MYPYADLPPPKPPLSDPLVNLLLLVDAKLAGASVGEKQKTTDDGENLEEIVLGEVLVGVMLVKLERQAVSNGSRGEKR